MKLGALSVGFLVVGLAVVGCGGSSKPMTPQCSLNSDCAKLSTPGLVCALGYCVKPCNISSDCPIGQRCIVLTAAGDAGTSTADAGVAQGTACQAPELATCNYNSMCTSPLICSSDHQCRDMCETNADCPGMGMGAGAQVCTSTTHLCADPAVDKDYNATINDFVVNDAGMGIPQGGNNGTGGNGTGTGGNGTGTGGSGGNGTGGSGHGGASGSGGGAGGAAGSSVNVCPSPQTSFAITASGDPNTAFTSGIGVRDGDEIFVFSAYVTPPSDGGPMGNFIYVQPFHAGSNGNWPKAGPAVRLFQAADGPSFGIFDVSVAPTGEIVVLHSVGNGNGFGAAQGYGFSSGVNLYASFLNLTNTSDGGADGGVAGLGVVDTVQLESVEETMPHVIWSVSAQAFIISWKYNTTSWFTRVRKFHPNGQSAGGDTANVPTTTGTNNNYGWDESQVGTSGNLIGVAYANPASGSNPNLTLLDGDGLQVGSIIAVNPTNSSHWVSIGGTTSGFVTLFNNSSTVYGVFIPTSGAKDVLTDGGTTRDAGGDAGLPGLFTDFSLPSTATTAKMVSDDTGGQDGVGAVLMETNGADFLYVTADGSKRLTSGTVISSAHGAEIGLTNYHGSFAVSLYDSTMHATQVVASGCSQ
jgi:hypothetical protein